MDTKQPSMPTYPKIQTLFKRHLEGPKKGKLIKGQWTTPALEYLSRNQWEFTEKVDGTNIRIGFDYRRLRHVANPSFGGRTENAVIPKHLLEMLEDWFHYDLFMDNDLRERVTLFGEGYGDKIQNGGKYFDKVRHLKDEPTRFTGFVLFDVKIGEFWLERENVNDIAKKLGIESVPVIGQGTLYDAIDIVESGLTWDSHGKMTNWGGTIGNNKRRFAGLKSNWGDFEAEGIVARPMTPLTDRKGDRIITKIKGVDFK